MVIWKWSQSLDPNVEMQASPLPEEVAVVWMLWRACESLECREYIAAVACLWIIIFVGPAMKSILPQPGQNCFLKGSEWAEHLSLSLYPCTQCWLRLLEFDTICSKTTLLRTFFQFLTIAFRNAGTSTEYEVLHISFPVSWANRVHLLGCDSRPKSRWQSHHTAGDPFQESHFSHSTSSNHWAQTLYPSPSEKKYNPRLESQLYATTTRSRYCDLRSTQLTSDSKTSLHCTDYCWPTKCDALPSFETNPFDIKAHQSSKSIVALHTR